MVILRVLDPAEVGFAFDNPSMFLTSSRAARCTSSPRRPRRVPPEVRRPRRPDRQDLRDLGIELLPIGTDRPLELVLFDLLKARMRRAAARPADPAGRGGAR